MALDIRMFGKVAENVLITSRWDLGSFGSLSLPRRHSDDSESDFQNFELLKCYSETSTKRTPSGPSQVSA